MSELLAALVGTTGLIILSMAGVLVYIIRKELE